MIMPKYTREFHDHRQRFSRLRRASDQQALCDAQRDGAAERDGGDRVRTNALNTWS
jgi:hypothetical protein